MADRAWYDYHIGIDGISILLVMLTTFLMPITLLSTQNSIHKGIRGVPRADAFHKRRYSGRSSPST
ncbi:MAG: hypothetical protein R3B51_05335 [Thermodesulfobacteriota bacterium]